MRAESSRAYTQPYRPTAVALANRVLGAAERMGWRVPLGERGVLASARRQAKREVFADDHYVVPLRQLLDAVDREARLHPVARVMARQIIAGHLANRLRIEALVDRHPEILGLPVEAPVFIVGLQRTGTTLLQRMLAEHPQLRALGAWEAIAPAPLDESPRPPGRLDPRIKLARMAERAAQYMSPDFFMVHPIIAEGNEEDSLAFDPSLVTTTAEALMNIPSFTAWMESIDHRRVYEEYRRVLQVLLWQRPGRWLGKTPLFLENLDLLLETFPDAKILNTHRDPVETVASLCSMLSHGRGFFSDEVDPHEVGRQWLAKTQRMVARSLETRKGRGDDAFLDVFYDNLMRDPMAELQRICDFAELRFTPEIEAQMRGFLEEHPQHKHGKHRYSLSDFGLTRADVEKAFAPYRSHFGLSSEP